MTVVVRVQVANVVVDQTVVLEVGQIARASGVVRC